MGRKLFLHCLLLLFGFFPCIALLGLGCHVYLLGLLGSTLVECVGFLEALLLHMHVGFSIC